MTPLFSLSELITQMEGPLLLEISKVMPGLYHTLEGLCHRLKEVSST